LTPSTFEQAEHSKREGVVMKFTKVTLLWAAVTLAYSGTSLAVIAGNSATKAAEVQALERAQIQQKEAALIQAKKQEELNAMAAQEAAAKAKANPLYQEELRKHALQQEAVKEKILTEEKAAQIQAAEGVAVRNAEQAKQAEKAAEWAARHPK